MLAQLRRVYRPGPWALGPGPMHPLDISTIVDILPAMPRAVTDLATAAERFHALSDPTRLRIIGMLQGGERCVCELMAELDAAQSRLSFHLRVLKDAGLV